MNILIDMVRKIFFEGFEQSGLKVEKRPHMSLGIPQEELTPVLSFKGGEHPFTPIVHVLFEDEWIDVEYNPGEKGEVEFRQFDLREVEPQEMMDHIAERVHRALAAIRQFTNKIWFYDTR